MCNSVDSIKVFERKSVGVQALKLAGWRTGDQGLGTGTGNRGRAAGDGVCLWSSVGCHPLPVVGHPSPVTLFHTVSINVASTRLKMTAPMATMTTMKTKL